ncbi:hypothetical protein LEL_07106 [Akanthomyces lecanii RCEF 1005]|uniref:Uncharacterized protein n=1 Tax=Akanthomyces lecanii RCEF 1005 TaxID=1081108 RepID=A0A162KHU9_CORDF|nr:hypothetical protein LEL_07106 [Akanthomyces lecanii RCEF 1005]
MADTAPPAGHRRRSFLGKLFGKKDKHNASDATPPPYENNTQTNPSATVDSAKEKRTENNHFHEAEEYIKDEEAKLKDHLHKAGEPGDISSESSTKKYFAKAENAAKKEGEKIEEDWKNAQRPESAEDKYGDLM